MTLALVVSSSSSLVHLSRVDMVIIAFYFALVIAIVNAVSGKAPLWIAVALLALAMILPGLPLKP